MTDLIEDAQAVADVVAPQIGLGARLVKWSLVALAIAAALALAGWVSWKLFFATGAAAAKHDQVQAQVAVGQAQAGQKSGADAVKVVIDNSKAGAAIDGAVKEAINAISKARGAAAALDPDLDAAGRRAVCMRASAAGLAGCDEVQRSHP